VRLGFYHRDLQEYSILTTEAAHFNLITWRRVREDSTNYENSTHYEDSTHYDDSTNYEETKTGNVQGGSNMTGTDLCVNKPHCAAAVRP
jgi:hypothetical protein